ncbi:unnamed protein product [Sphagnum balticum]
MAEADIAAGSTASPTTWGAVVLAQAPAAEGLLCDVNNGPKPHVFSIKEALGADIDVVGAIPNAIPSVTFGTPISPDTLRAGLFLPIQQGFKRTIDYVRGLEDVTGVEYGYTDTQVPVNFVAGPFANPSMPGNQPPTIGAISQAGPNAVAGYNLGNIISPSSTPGATTYGATSSGATTYGNVPQSGQNNSTVSSVTSMSYSWSYSLGAFFPGNFFNDALANGGGV